MGVTQAPPTGSQQRVDHLPVYAHVAQALEAHGAGVRVARVGGKAVGVHEVAAGRLLHVGNGGAGATCGVRGAQVLQLHACGAGSAWRGPMAHSDAMGLRQRQLRLKRLADDGRKRRQTGVDQGQRSSGGPRVVCRTCLDGVLGLEEPVGADGARPCQALLHASVLVEQLQAHAGVAGHAVEGVHAQPTALQQTARREHSM